MQLDMAKIPVMPQEFQIPAFTNFTTPIVGVSGGKRSGKSRIISCEKLLVATSIHPGGDFVLASPTNGMNRRNLWPLLKEIAARMGIKFEGSGKLGPNMPPFIQIRWGDKVSTIHLDISIENYGRINGLSLAGVYVDEIDKARASEAEGFLEEALIRLSKPYPGQIAQLNVTGAPELNGYFHEFMVEKNMGDRILYKWSMLENMAISAAYKDAQMRQIPPSKRAGWIHGDFMFNSDGMVYSDYDPALNHTNFTMEDLEPGRVFENADVFVAWDINNGGCAVNLMVRHGRHIFILAEWVKMESTKHIIDKVKKQWWAKRAILTCDPASTQVLPYIKEAAYYGVRNMVMTKAPEIDWRVTAVNKRFGTSSAFRGTELRHLLVNTKTCKTLNKCLMRQQYIRVGDENIPDKKMWLEEAGTDISGPIDAMGYPVYMLFPYNPKNPGSQVSLR